MIPKGFIEGHAISRWQLLGIVFTCIAISFATAVAFYVIYVPNDTRETDGIIVSYETTASKSSPRVRHFLHVRLDDGLVVTARAGSHVTPKVGRRVKLTATRMPLIGIERFRFKEFNDPPVDTNPLLKR